MAEKGKKGKEVKAVEEPKKSYGRVRPCNCEHTFQDKEYGKGMRLHTEAKGGSVDQVKYRCTVCLSMKS
jgi:hypothetical protein